MECRNIQEKLSGYLDSMLPSGEKELVEEHLGSCSVCSQYLADLKRTIEYVGRLEEVEPPVWMTQKIMARVKKDAEPRKGLLRTLFYPLHIKLPLEAVAMLAVAVITLYIFRAIPSGLKQAQVPSEISAPAMLDDKESPRDSEEGKPLYSGDDKPSSPVIAMDDAIRETRKTEKYSAITEEPDNTHLTPGTEKEMAPVQREKMTASEEKGFAPVMPSARPEQRESRYAEEYEPEQTAHLAGKDMTIRSMGRLDKTERPARTEEATAEITARAASPAKPPSAANEPGIRFILNVGNLAAALREIEYEVGQFEGKIIQRETREKKEFISVELNHQKVGRFLEKLKLIGEVQEADRAFESGEGITRIHIEIGALSE